MSLRVVVLDSNLEMNEGHHDHFARHARESFAASGVEMVVHGCARAAPALVRQHGVIPSFHRRAYDMLSQDPFDGLLAEVLQGAGAFAREAERCLAASARPGDLVLLPTASLGELVGLTRLAQRQPPSYRLAALFHRAGPAPFRDAGPGTLTGALLRDLGRHLPVFDGRGLWLGGVTGRLCATLTEAIGRPVQRAPSPVWYAPTPPRKGPGPRTIGILGHLRVEKARFDLVALTTALAGAAPDARVLIAGHHERAGADLRSLRGLAARRVEVRLDWQEEDAFAATVAECDLIVLPYDRRAYADASSGIFCHAVAHGTPTVAPAGTWMADQIARGRAAGLAYAEETLPALVETVRAALSDIEALQARAAACAPQWRRAESGARLVDGLLAFARA